MPKKDKQSQPEKLRSLQRSILAHCKSLFSGPQTKENGDRTALYILQLKGVFASVPVLMYGRLKNEELQCKSALIITRPKKCMPKYPSAPNMCNVEMRD